MSLVEKSVWSLENDGRLLQAQQSSSHNHSCLARCVLFARADLGKWCAAIDLVTDSLVSLSQGSETAHICMIWNG